MVKNSTIGGVYNRPIALANFAHFLIGGIALIKAILHHENLPLLFSIVTGCYIILAIVFGLLLRRQPTTKAES